MMSKILKQLNKRNNEKGAALVVSMFALTALFGLTASFALTSTAELGNSSRHRDSTEAFWIAEAGINRFLQDTTLLDGGDQTVNIGSHSVALSKDDSDSQQRIVTATATVDGVERSIQVTFPANPPSLFDNTLSSGGNIDLDGFIAGLTVDGQTRLSGQFHDNGFWTSGSFDDKQENISSSLTTLQYPDMNNNGTSDEFSDFVAYNSAFVDPTDPNYTGEYSADEVLHIQTDGTVNLWPFSDLQGKKVVFVEGSTAGAGDVNIWFDTSWLADQNITVISTGSVNYVQPLQNPAANSQLNTISWDSYNELAILYSTHSGVTYTHDEAHYGSIISFSQTSGLLVSNSDVSLDLILVWKQFDYENPIDDNGAVPPAFQGLISGGGGGYSSEPDSWIES